MKQVENAPGLSRYVCAALLVLVAGGLTGRPLAGEPMPVAADAVFVNGKLWTVNPKQPQAEALAVGRGRILAVGSSQEICRRRDEGHRLAGPPGCTRFLR